jgi:hypothetical protein
MRVFGHLLLALCVSGTAGLLGQAPATPPATPKADERAAKVLADARAALGGESRLSAVKSFTTTGRTRRVQGDNLVPIEFEMLVELPDKYLRKDEIPAQESDPTTIGFNGDALLQIPSPAPPAPRPGMPAPPPEMFENLLKQRALTARQDFARLMLGMFATSFEAYPLAFAYVGQAQAPEGQAHVLEATGANNFKLRFFVDMKTSLPIMVSWTAPGRPTPAGRGAPGAPSSPGGATPPAAPQAAAPARPASAPAPQAAAPARPASAPAPRASAPAPQASAAAPQAPEQRLYFADYRDVDGLRLPFRLRRGVGVNTTEETTFDRFRLNPKIDPRRFEVRK